MRRVAVIAVVGHLGGQRVRERIVLQAEVRAYIKGSERIHSEGGDVCGRGGGRRVGQRLAHNCSCFFEL